MYLSTYISTYFGYTHYHTSKVRSETVVVLVQQIVEEERYVVDGCLTDLVHVKVMLVLGAQLFFLVRPFDDDTNRRRRRRSRREHDRLGERRCGRRDVDMMATVAATAVTSTLTKTDQE